MTRYYYIYIFFLGGEDFSFIGATICNRQEIQCLPYAGFFDWVKKFPKVVQKYKEFWCVKAIWVIVCIGAEFSPCRLSLRTFFIHENSSNFILYI